MFLSHLFVKYASSKNAMNFKHLHYFWVTARAGGVLRAGEQLHTTPQTLSAQIKLLEDRLGRKLFRKSGRKLELTDDGHVALRYADEIFHLGAELQAALRETKDERRVLDFRVAVADSVAKSVVVRLLEPALQLADPVRLSCSEGIFTELMGQLAMHKVDLVITDEPLDRQASVKAYNHPLGSSPMSFFAAPSLLPSLQGGFPHALHGAPLLLPGATSSVRRQLDAWLARHHVRPRGVAEFDDSALMAAFGRDGFGVFVAPTVLEAEVAAQHAVQVIGRSEEIVEQFFGISIERRIRHPCVQAITDAARARLFSA